MRLNGALNCALNRTIRFWVLGGYSYGLGHVVRARWLSEHLAQRWGVRSVFRVNDYAPAVDYLQKAGACLEGSVDAEIGSDTEAPLLEIVDALDAEEALLKRAGARGTPVICFENRTGTARFADAVINPIVAGLDDHSWLEHGVPHHGGPGYLFLAPEVTALRPKEPRATTGVERVLVSCGGTDPSGQTLRALALLDRSMFRGRIDVIQGAGSAPIVLQARSGCDVHVFQGLATLGEQLAKADLALLSGGMTLYEAAALGLPSLVLAQNEHQEVTGRRFEAKGCACFLDGASPEENLRVLNRLLAEPDLRTQMSKHGMALLDGQAHRLFPLLETFLPAWSLR